MMRVSGIAGVSTWIALLLIASGFIERIQAFPIPPATIRDLYIRAELVVIVTVIGVEELEWPKEPEDIKRHLEHWWSLGFRCVSAKANLSITRVFKGKPKGNDITVFFSPDLLCPSPARLPEGKQVLAFLTFVPKVDGYKVESLSYGSRVLDASALTAYSRALEELQKVLDLDNPVKKKKALVEWMIACVEKEPTRWDGTFELNSRVDKQKENKYWQRLDKTQWERLLGVFLGTKYLESRTDFAVLWLLSHIDDHKYDERLIQYLEDIDKDYHRYGYGNDVIKILRERLGLHGDKFYHGKHILFWSPSKASRIEFLKAFVIKARQKLAERSR